MFALVAAALYGVDQLTKYLVVANLELGRVVPVLGEVLQLRYVRNDGAAFSIGSGFTWVFTIASTLIAIAIVWYARRLRSLPWAVTLGLVLGGALGNLTDRLVREPSFGLGHVIDFIQLYAFPAIFNIADMGVVIGMGAFILLTFRGRTVDGRREQATASAAGSPAES